MIRYGKIESPYVDTFPLVSIFAQETRDMQNALKGACETHVPIRFRSGGHALDKSLSEVKDGIVIDVSEMKRIRLNRKEEIAIVETGSDVGRTVKALAREGDMLPFGDSPTVGVGGITMGGGNSFNDRLV